MRNYCAHRIAVLRKSLFCFAYVSNSLGALIFYLDLIINCFDFLKETYRQTESGREIEKEEVTERQDRDRG